MIRRFLDWLDHRTGYRKFTELMLLEHIPGGAKWRYVWGSCLAFVFTVQLVTGILLMFHYSPGDSTAWGSVYFIQYEMDFGWLIRGLHHFGSQTMVVLLGIHMLQVVIAGAHLPPREINWWVGLGLLGLVLGLSLTGYLLPWDQKGFWATQVATNIAGNLPAAGADVQKGVVGGPEYGHHTLTHFYALHVGVLPALLVVMLIVHIALFRRHGVTAPANAKGEGLFWPDQAFRDMIASMLVFGVMLALVVFGGHGNKIESEATGWYDRVAHAGRDGLGADLDAPADPATESYPARPEWYFLFLFQLLKYFEGDQEIIGTLLIPGAVMGLLFILPLLGHGRMRRFGHAVGVMVIVGLLTSVGLLTFLAFRADEESERFQADAAKAHKLATRAVQLAHQGIPEEGGRFLLRNDPKTRGWELFKQNCAVCHSYTSSDPEIESIMDETKNKFKASDLGDYAREKWIRGLLHKPSDSKYFGRTKLRKMKQWREEIDSNREEALAKDPEKAKKDIAEEEKALDLIARWLADQAKPDDERDAKLEALGLKAFDRKTPFADRRCASCHGIDRKIGGKLEALGGASAPNFTDYGSQDWVRFMIMSPGHGSRFGKANDMPAFRNLEDPASKIHLLEFREPYERDEKSPPTVLHLSDVDRELIIRFVTRDYRVVFGGKTISGPVK